MTTIRDILARAQQRGKEMDLPYQGAVTPIEAYELVQRAPGACIVDVRSRAEWDFVGRIPGAIEIEWKTYPGMKPNPDFLAALERQVDRESMVLFICRSGVRSHDAAALATQRGYRDSYNVLEGFEGDRDGHQHRSTIGGWRAAGLPWVQS
jgi:rhodanese-related sulfurtransferase